MTTIELTLDGDWERLLNQLSVQTRRDKHELVERVVHDYLRAEALRERLADPELVNLYRELEAEDVRLSESGISDYARSLAEEDAA